MMLYLIKTISPEYEQINKILIHAINQQEAENMAVQEIEETNINLGIDKKPIFIIEPLILDRSKIIMKELM